jgi:hypothetical protein
MGTAVAVAIMIVAGVGQALSEKAARKQDQDIILKMDQIYGGSASATDKIDQLSQLIPKLTSQATQGEQRRRLASLYEKLGHNYIAGNAGNQSSLVAAENAYRQAISLDEKNGVYLQDLAELYTKFAESSQSAEDRMQLYQQSVQMWIQAAERFPADSNEQLSAMASAGNVYYTMANYLSQFGDGYVEQAGDYVREGLGITPESTPEGRAIRQRLEALEGRLRLMG